MRKSKSGSVVSAILGMAALYAGKTSGILVAFLFLPLYSKILGVDEFGLVAVLISLQSLLIMLDLGMAIVAGREIASGCSAAEARRLILRAEQTLAGVYGILLLVLVALKAAGCFSSLSWYELCASVCLCLVLVLQNLHYSAQLATGSYRVSTILQVVGVLLRAVVTLYVLERVERSFFAFVVVQLAVAVVHFFAARFATAHMMPLGARLAEANLRTVAAQCIGLLVRGRCLVLSGIAGAAALQLDKPIISLFMASGDVTPYFLAVTLSATPVGVLAAPVVQFFQPKIVGAISSKNRFEIDLNVRRFTLAILVAVCIPAGLMIIFADEIVGIWLNGAAWSGDVASYSRILLMGYATAAVGYVPYVIAIAKQDYKYQANLSLFLTGLLLIAVMISAMSLNITWICYAYVVYFVACALGLLYRLRNKELRYG